MQIRITKFIINFSTIGTIFLVPIYFAFFLKNNSVFILNKTILFQILIILLFLSSFYYFYLNSAKKIKIHLNKKIAFLLILLIFSNLLSFFISINKYLSLYGLYSRKQGLLIFFYLISFFLLILLNKKILNLKKIFFSLISSSFLVSVYGLIQLLQLDPFKWIEPSHTRVFSSIGQPNFLASFLLLTIPFSLYLLIPFLLSENNKKLFFQIENIEKYFCSKKFFYQNKYFFLSLLIFFLQIIILLKTYSRGAYLGLFLGFIFSVIIFIFNKRCFLSKYLEKIKPSKINKKILFILSSILVLFIIIFTNSNFIKRVQTSFNFQKGSLAVRFDIWQRSLEAIKQKPFLGYGLETQGEILVKSYKTKEALFSYPNSYPNRAHNIILDIILTQGLLGLLIYFLFITYFFQIIFKNIKIKNKPYLFLSIFLALTSYLFSLLFSFSNISDLIYFWFLLALILILDKTEKQKKINIIFNLHKKIIFIFIYFMFLCFGINNIYVFSKEYLADYYLREAKLNLLINNNFFKFYDYYEKLNQLQILDNFYQKEFASTMSQKISTLKQEEKKIALDLLKIIFYKIEPVSFDHTFIKAKTASLLINTVNKDLFTKEAKFYINNLIQQNPNMPKLYEVLGDIYKNTQNYQLAKKNYQLALEKLPDDKNNLANHIHKQVLEYEKNILNSKIKELKL